MSFLLLAKHIIPGCWLVKSSLQTIKSTHTNLTSTISAPWHCQYSAPFFSLCFIYLWSLVWKYACSMSIECTWAIVALHGRRISLHFFYQAFLLPICSTLHCTCSECGLSLYGCILRGNRGQGCLTFDPIDKCVPADALSVGVLDLGQALQHVVDVVARLVVHQTSHKTLGESFHREGL